MAVAPLSQGWCLQPDHGTTRRHAAEEETTVPTRDTVHQASISPARPSPWPHVIAAALTYGQVCLVPLAGGIWLRNLYLLLGHI